MVTTSKEEAFALLRRYRKVFIIKGREIAHRVCQVEGTVHSRRIHDEMREAIEQTGVGTKWLGCVFNKEFKWTGEWFTMPRDLRTNNHGGQLSRVWREA